MSEPRHVGIVGRLVEGSDAWSGIPAGLAEGLASHGYEAFCVSAEPPPRVIRAVRAYLRRVHRLTDTWEQAPEMMLVRQAAVRKRVLALRVPRGTGWIQMGSEFGSPLPRGFVTFEDMTVASALRLPEFPGANMPSGAAASWLRVQGRIYDRARACCVASSWQASSLLEDYGVPRHKVRVVGLGCSLWPQEEPARSWEVPKFLFVGLGWKRKNGSRVLHAFQELRSTHPTATLDIVGDHPEISAPGVTTHGRLRQSVPHERAALATLFAQSTCFVLPSLYEPFGIVHAEAGAAGIPSIGTEVGGARDAVGPRGGVFVDPRDDRALLNAMTSMAIPDRARTAGAAARAHAERLRWDRVAERVLTALGRMEGERELTQASPGTDLRVDP